MATSTCSSAIQPENLLPLPKRGVYNDQYPRTSEALISVQVGQSTRSQSEKMALKRNMIDYPDVERFKSLGSRTLRMSSNTWIDRLESAGLHDLKGGGGFGTVDPNHLIEV